MEWDGVQAVSLLCLIDLRHLLTELSGVRDVRIIRFVHIYDNLYQRYTGISILSSEGV